MFVITVVILSASSSGLKWHSLPRIAEGNTFVAGADNKRAEELNKLDDSNDDDCAVLVGFLVVFALVLSVDGGFLGYRLAAHGRRGWGRGKVRLR